jgi:adenine-specific DNA-methyltransferase
MPGINFRSIILSILEADERIWFQNEEGEKELNQTLLLDLVEKIDDKIINLLLQEEALREKFFAKISPDTTEKHSTYVFKMNDFRFFMEENKIDNSYTAYKNRIGLTDGKKFLKDSNDIILNWPYKDCILEGGQSNEEGSDTYFEKIPLLRGVDKVDGVDYSYIQKQAKRKEIFFNSVLAPDEIDRLLDPKALVNWKRFTKDGQIPLLRGVDKVDGVDALKRDKNGTIAENMIIKGNNLLAMHSLKKQFTGKVKLIYIDPPYNTGNDGFKYNDNFNHSTWLTFMKNRLEVARELLREDGVIFVSCDDNEQGYLKVLMDEVFGRENFVNNIIWHKKRGKDNSAKYFSITHENLIVFGKQKKNLKILRNELDESTKKAYKNQDDDPRGEYRILGIWSRQQGGSEFEYTTNKGNFYSKRLWLVNKATMKKLDDDNRLIENEDRLYYKKFLSENTGSIPETIWKDTSNNANAKDEIKNLFGDAVFVTPKPEPLLERIIQISTQPGDIVLDYHLGSGTTAAVAHKMGRQYIGIEQMDYVETIAVERLKKVIGQSTSPAKAGTPQEENSRKLTAKERQGLQEILEKIKNSNNSLV